MFNDLNRIADSLEKLVNVLNDIRNDQKKAFDASQKMMALGQENAVKSLAQFTNLLTGGNRDGQ